MRKSHMSQDGVSNVVRIKKYANRRLYNTETSAYVTLEDLAEMVRAERDFEVVDAKTNEDLTHSVLTQIILDQEGKGENLLPINFLRQLIRFYGNSMQGLVPSYLDISMEALAREQDNLRKQFETAIAANPMVKGGAMMTGMPIEAMQRQAQQNMEIFQRAFEMFTPFAPGHGESVSDDAEAGSAKGAAGPASEEAHKAKSASGSGKPKGDAARPATRDELQDRSIDELRAQITAIQEQLEKFGNS